MDERLYRELLKQTYKDITVDTKSGIKNINVAVETMEGNFIVFEAMLDVTFGVNPTYGPEVEEYFIKNINVIEYSIYEYNPRDPDFAEPVEGFDIKELKYDLIDLSL